MDYLIVLRRTMNYNKAAKELGVSQPTLSYQISTLEEEIGFKIFERNGKGISITPAGDQFCSSVINIRSEISRSIEQSQNISGHFREDIRIGLSLRSSLHLLPMVMRDFSDEFPDISVSPVIHQYGDYGRFMSGNTDIEFAFRGDLGKHGVADEIRLYRSGIMLICGNDDFLANRDLIHEEDLYGRTLMVGGGSPPELKEVQRRLIDTGRIQYFNSNDHDTTLINVAARKGVCLAPGFLNDRDGQNTWIPFDCPEHFDCVLCVRKGEKREPVRRLVQMLKEAYSEYDGPL